MPPGSTQPFYKKCLLLPGQRMNLVHAAWLLYLMAVVSAQSTTRALYSVGDEEKGCEVNGIHGRCMFVWQCINSSGTHIGVCMDKFIFGSCCIHPNMTTGAVGTTGGGSVPDVIYSPPSKRPATPPPADSFHSSTTHFFTSQTKPSSSSTTAVTLRPTDLVIFTNRPSFVTKPERPSSHSPLDKWSIKPWENEIDNHVDSSWHSTSFVTKVRPTSGWLHVTTQQRPGTTTRRPTSAWYSTVSSTSRPTTTTKQPHTTTQWTALKPTKHRPNTGWTNSAKPTTTRPTKWPSTSWTNPVSSSGRPTTKRTTPRPTTTTQLPVTTTSTPTPFVYSPNITNTQCGVRSVHQDVRPEVRIVGGRNAQFGDWPWQVSVRRTSFFGFSSTHRCGGALINDRWVATAGHCVDDLLVSQIRLRVGEYDFSSTVEPYPHTERGASRKVVHPNYNFFTYEHDLALVRMDGPVEFGPNIAPICLPASDDLLVGETATITGWGRLSDGGTLPSVLQEVSVPILSNVRCRYLFLRAGRHEFFPEIFLCAGLADGGRDACQGDSGGPLQVKGKDSRYFLAGIISWGIGCAEANLPGVCTRISKFVPWILQTVS